MDDRTVGLVLRALRRRLGWRQVDLAERAGCSQSLVSQVERGHLGATTIDTLRSLFGAVGARLKVAPGWRGADLERLLDADHAAIVEALARRLERADWEVMIEVTYAIGAERGSIDLLALQPLQRAALVAEVKSDIAAAEAVGRKLDEKRRLAPAIVRARAGWVPNQVGVALVMPESTRLRRLFDGPAAALARMFPVSSRAIALWLREPDRPLAATWFLSGTSPRNARRVRAAPKRSGGASPADPVGVVSVARDLDDPPTRILR